MYACISQGSPCQGSRTRCPSPGFRIFIPAFSKLVLKYWIDLLHFFFVFSLTFNPQCIGITCFIIPCNFNIITELPPLRHFISDFVFNYVKSYSLVFPMYCIRSGRYFWLMGIWCFPMTISSVEMLSILSRLTMKDRWTRIK